MPPEHLHMVSAEAFADVLLWSRPRSTASPRACLLHDGLELRLGEPRLFGEVGQDVGQQVVDGGGALRS